MKNLIKILFVSILFAYSSYSQIPPFPDLGCGPDPDCITKPMSHTVIIPYGNCAAILDYQLKICGTPPNQTYMFEMGEIEFWRPSIYPNCTGLPSIDEIVEDCKAELLRQTAYLLFPHGILPPNFEITIRSSTCYEMLTGGNYGPGVDYLSPCGECCEQTYELDQFAIANGFTFSIRSSNQLRGDETLCSTPPSDCKAACESSTVPDGPLPLIDYYATRLCQTGGTWTDMKVLSAESTAFTGTSGVKFVIYYSSSVTSPSEFNYRIHQIYVYDGTDFNPPAPAKPEEEAVEAAIRKLMEIRHTEFVYQGYDDAGNDKINFWINTCWRKVGDSYVPRDGVCCTITADIDGTHNYTLDSYTGPGNVCGFGTGWEFVCEPVYDDLDANIYTSPKLGFDVETDSGLTNLELMPNPTSNMTKLQFENDLEGEVEIGLYTTNGFEVYKRTYNKSGKEFSLDLNTSNTASGAYFVNIYMQGKLIGTTQLIVE